MLHFFGFKSFVSEYAVSLFRFEVLQNYEQGCLASSFTVELELDAPASEKSGALTPPIQQGARARAAPACAVL